MIVEKGYNAISGIRPQDIDSWADFKKVLKQLENPAAKDMYEVIIVDTADQAYYLCQNYVARKYGEEDIEEISYGRGFSKAQTEFDQCLRKIVSLGYGLVIISHSQQKTYKDEEDREYSRIEPTIDKRGMLVCSRLCDIIGLAKPSNNETGESKTKLYLRGTPRYIAGSRFKYMPFSIDFSYSNLVNAIADAIERQEQEEGAENFTNEIQRPNYEKTKYDFDSSMTEVQSIIADLMAKDKEYYAPRIKEIVEKEFGKNKKISEAERSQIEQVIVVLDELKELQEQER